jgi:hypothetical protein
MWRDIPIGRIHRQNGVPVGRPNWAWSLAFPHMQQQPHQRGLVSDLEECKRRFKVAWSAIEPQLTDEDIRKAKEQTQNSKDRPWNRHKTD